MLRSIKKVIFLSKECNHWSPPLVHGQKPCSNIWSRAWWGRRRFWWVHRHTLHRWNKKLICFAETCTNSFYHSTLKHLPSWLPRRSWFCLGVGARFDCTSTCKAQWVWQTRVTDFKTAEICLHLPTLRILMNVLGPVRGPTFLTNCFNQASPASKWICL